jgi:hypothetical protein
MSQTIGIRIAKASGEDVEVLQALSIKPYALELAIYQGDKKNWSPHIHPEITKEWGNNGDYVSWLSKRILECAAACVSVSESTSGTLDTRRGTKMDIKTYLVARKNCVICSNSYGVPEEGQILCEEHQGEGDDDILEGVLGEEIVFQRQSDRYIEKLEAALIDILEGNSQWHEIQYNTGLSEERCHELEGFFSNVLENYRRKHGI